jgi:hypothetical protein
MQTRNYIFEPKFQNILLKALDYSPAKNISNLLKKYIENKKIMAVYVTNPKYSLVQGGFQVTHKSILINLKALGIKIGMLGDLVYSKYHLKELSSLIVHEIIHLIFFKLSTKVEKITKPVLKKFYTTFLVLFSGYQNSPRVVKWADQYLDILMQPDYTKRFNLVVSFLSTVSKHSIDTEFCNKETREEILELLKISYDMDSNEIESFIEKNKDQFIQIQKIFQICYMQIYSKVPPEHTFIQELYAPDEVLALSSTLNTPRAIETYIDILKLLPQTVS